MHNGVNHNDSFIFCLPATAWRCPYHVTQSRELFLGCDIDIIDTEQNCSEQWCYDLSVRKTYGKVKNMFPKLLLSVIKKYLGGVIPLLRYIEMCHSREKKSQASIKIISVVGSNGLTHWGRDKMASVFQTTLSNAFSSKTIVPNGPIDNITPMVQIMAWRRPGDKPLFDQWWLDYRRIYMRHSASMS